MPLSQPSGAGGEGRGTRRTTSTQAELERSVDCPERMMQQDDAQCDAVEYNGVGVVFTLMVLMSLSQPSGAGGEDGKDIGSNASDNTPKVTQQGDAYRSGGKVIRIEDSVSE